MPVHPANRHLLAMEWKSGVIIDACLPFGLRSLPKLFNLLADLLAWILEHQGISYLLHYLDDFLTIGQPLTSECHYNLMIMKQVCPLVEVPLTTEKVEGPSTGLDFLGILLDTVRMEAQLPYDKLARLKAEVTSWLDKHKVTKCQVLSLVGLLQHAAKVVRAERKFVRCRYSVAAQVKELDHFTWLKRFRSDLFWWHTFMSEWNGCSFLKVVAGEPHPQIAIQTDARGCGALF